MNNTCPICIGTMRNKKILRCGHTYCKTVYRSMV